MIPPDNFRGASQSDEIIVTSVIIEARVLSRHRAGGFRRRSGCSMMCLLKLPARKNWRTRKLDQRAGL
jgi:hypothetical protein